MAKMWVTALPRLLLLSICLTWAAPVAAENLLANGDLEGPPGKDGCPAGWSLAWKATRSTDKGEGTDRQAPDFALDQEVRHSGKQSVRLGVARPTDDAFLRQVVKGEWPEKAVYRVRAWIKTKGVQKGDARITVAFGGAKGEWLGADYGLIRIDTDSDWACHAALFLVPRGTREVRLALWVNHVRTGGVTAWFDDVSLERTKLSEIPPPRHVDPRPMPPLSAGDEARGYVPFRTNYLDMIFPDTVPAHDEVGGELNAFASLGEYEPVTFAIRALRDLEGVSVKLAELTGPGGGRICGDAIDVRAVRFLPKKPHYSKMEWMLVPALLEKRDQLSIAASTTQPYWITIHTPANVPPGLYRGQVQIAVRGGAGCTIPVKFEVLPIRLVEPEGVCLGMYDSEKCYGSDPDALYRKYVDMREHGMNSVGFCGGLGGTVTWEGGKAKIAWDETKGLALAMKCFRRAGLRGPMHWLMSGTTEAALKQGSLQSPEFAAAYRSMIEAVLAESRRHGWPEIIFQPEDEAFEHRARWDRMVRTLKVMKSVPGVRTEMDGMNGNPEGLEQVLPLIDVLNYHDGPHLIRRVYDGPGWARLVGRLTKAGKEVWFYNIDTTGYHPEIMRFGYGFHLIRCRAKGSFCWAYQWGTADPYTDPPKGFNFMFRYPELGKEPGGPSTGWEATREGVDDYRYWLTYRRAVESAVRSGNAAKVGLATITDQLLQEGLDRIEYDEWTQPGHQGRWTGGQKTDENGLKTCSGHYKLPNGWDFAEPNRLRRVLADAIIQLQR